MTKIVKMDWTKTGHRFTMKSQNGKRDSAKQRTLQKSSTELLMRKKNADIYDEPSMLPKVKSTAMSQPKFLSKSRMMALGVNKFIGGTYRNTSLAQQQLNQSKSSATLIGGLSRASIQNQPSGAGYDASGYTAATSRAPREIEEEQTKKPNTYRVRGGMFEAGNQPLI